MNFGESLKIQAFNSPGKIAIKEDGRSVTYEQLNHRVNSLVHGMLDTGLRKGNTVCQLQRNTVEHVELLYAAAKAGMVRLPLNPRANELEIAAMINRFKPDALVFEDSFSPLIAKVRNQVKCPRYIYIGSNPPADTIFYKDLATKFPETEPDIEVEENDPLLIGSTSGTTGLPKAPWLTHRAMIMRSLFRCIEMSFSCNDIYLVTNALGNTFAAFFAMAYWFIGGSIILHDRFDPVKVLETIEKEKVTSLGMVPIMYERVLQVPNLKKYDLSSLRMVTSTGAPLHTETKEKIIKNICPYLYEVMGGGETGPLCILRPEDQLRKTRCVGQQLLQVRLKLIDTDGREVPVGEEGEIVAQTPYQAMGYFKNPETTAEVFRDGWVYTGDTGKFDEEHYLYVVGRSKDMIISGGYNIYAEEIEDVLYKHPKVLEAAVIGIPDQQWGEAVKAIVVLKPNEKATEEEIIEFCRKSDLASYKKPQSVDFMDSLPRTDVGKILKRKLREIYWAGQERQVA